jgi:hypothetical protein
MWWQKNDAGHLITVGDFSFSSKIIYFFGTEAEDPGCGPHPPKVRSEWFQWIFSHNIDIFPPFLNFEQTQSRGDGRDSGDRWT